MNAPVESLQPIATIGFTGKVPINADYVTRFLPPVFTEFWDHWVDEGIQESKKSLGAEWQSAFLVAPVWHISILPGILGPTGWLGVMIPSVDQSGRYYPMLVASSFSSDQHHLPASELILERLEGIAIAALDEGITLQALEILCQQEKLNQSESLLCQTVASPLEGSVSDYSFKLNLHPELSTLCLSGNGTSRLLGSPVCFWSSGSPFMKPAVHFFAELPEPSFFSSMIKDVTNDSDHTVTFSHPSYLPQNPDLRALASQCLDTPAYTSRSRTHPGQREVNQDAFLELPDRKLWAVADGMGGHECGERASQLVVELLSELPRSRYSETLLGRVIKSLTTANEELQSISLKELKGQVTGSTFVGLVMDDWNAYVVWVGDSRIYRLREGCFEQLTSDHVLTMAQGRTALSRAVGGTHQLEIDTRRVSVSPGDQYLLCSDGLYRAVSEQEMTEILRGGSLDEKADQLMALALQREAKDNITLVIVERRQEPVRGE